MTKIKVLFITFFLAFTGITSPALAEGNAEAFLEAAEASNLVLEMRDVRDDARSVLNMAMADALAPAQMVASAEMQHALSVKAMDAVAAAGIADPAIIDPMVAEIAARQAATETAKGVLEPLTAAIKTAEAALTVAESNVAAANAVQATKVADYEDLLMAPVNAYKSAADDAVTAADSRTNAAEDVAVWQADQLAKTTAEKITLADMIIDHCNRNDDDHQICGDYADFLENGVDIPVTPDMLEN